MMEYQYSWSRQERIKLRKRKKGSLRKKFLLFIIFIAIFYLGKNYFFSHTVSAKLKEKTIISAIPAVFQQPTSIPTPTPTPVEQSSAGLAKAVQSALVDTTGTYGVVIKNLKTGESYYQNPHESFESGSLYKLWVMTVAFQQIQNGTLHQSDVLSKDAASLNQEFDVDPDEAEQTTGTITYSIQDALYQMITISDNNAALLLTSKIGLPSLEDFLTTYGFTESKIGINGNSPTTTPSDIALFLQKLYSGQLANRDETNQMITLLKEQKLNEKIPEYLPDSVVVAHKTGELGQFSHDAGIVYAPFGNYIIVVLSESDEPLLANERIANVSQAVYNYFTNENQ